MKKILDNGNLKEYQEYIKKVLEERNLHNTDLKSTMNLLTEEIGELSKAIRKHIGNTYDRNSHVGQLDEEIADVFIVLIAIANMCNVDINEAFIKKEEKNNERTWS